MLFNKLLGAAAIGRLLFWFSFLTECSLTNLATQLRRSFGKAKYKHRTSLSCALATETLTISQTTLFNLDTILVSSHLHNANKCQAGVQWPLLKKQAARSDRNVEGPGRLKHNTKEVRTIIGAPIALPKIYAYSLNPFQTQMFLNSKTCLFVPIPKTVGWKITSLVFFSYCGPLLNHLLNIKHVSWDVSRPPTGFIPIIPWFSLWNNWNHN